METHSGFATVEGTTLYYELCGDGPTIALLHGRGADHRMWPDQVPVLAQRYRVLNYDMRGFGQSPPSEAPYSHADDLAGLLDHLGIERVSVMGLSLGGGAAVNFAVLYPERTQALIAVDSSLGGFPWSPWFHTWMESMRREAATHGVESVHALYAASPFFTRLDARATTLMRTILTDYSGWHWLHPDRGRPLVPPAIARLGTIRAPTLVVVGEHDQQDFLDIAATLERGIPGARRVVMQGVGHVPTLEDPARFNAILLEFLDSVHAGAPRARAVP